MGFFSKLFAEIKKNNELKKQLVNPIVCEVDRGENHIFTKKFMMGKTSDGFALINLKHKVQIISCSEYHEVETVKSVGKKVAGAVVGGVLTGGAGAIVGALAVGNNKKKTSNFDKLVAVDEFGHTHEIVLKRSLGQRRIINNTYFN